jgi:glycosyltransferase 2 family protein
VFATLKTINVAWIALALAIFLIAQVISSLRWVYVARTLGGALSLSRAVEAHFVGLWFNQVFPTSLGGDVVKVAMVKRELGLSLAIRSAILDRVSGLVFLLVSVLVLLPAYHAVLKDLQLTIVLGVFAFSSLLAMVLLARFAIRFAEYFVRVPTLHHVFHLFDNIWQFRKGRPLWEQTWTSLIVHVNGILAYALIGAALGVNANWLVYFLMTPLVFLVALLPVSLAGWGLREFGAVWLFGMASIPAESALTMSILYGLLLIAAGVPGLVLMLCGAASDRRGRWASFRREQS